jgi:cytochrome P450
LIVAGHETTVHLITNAVETLLRHPDQLARLRAEPELMEPAVEEILRYSGPIHGTKPHYPLEPVTLHGVTIPKGAAVMPLLGAANFDPSVFDDPETFDIARTPNKHLAFGLGIHYCLGAPLAWMETQIALKTLFGRYPELRLAVRPDELKLRRLPAWHSYESLPVVLG